MKRKLIAGKLDPLGRCSLWLGQKTALREQKRRTKWHLRSNRGYRSASTLPPGSSPPEEPASGPRSMSGKFKEPGRLKIITPEIADGMKQSLELRKVFIDNCRSASRDSLSAPIHACAQDFSRFADSVRAMGEDSHRL